MTRVTFALSTVLGIICVATATAHDARTAEQERIAAHFEAGKACKMTVEIEHKKCFGTITRGTEVPYNIEYLKNNRWAVFGYNCVFENDIEAVYGGANPQDNEFMFWGVLFQIDGTGYARAKLDTRVGGQMICE